MNLAETIVTDMRTAMKKQEKEKLTILRMLVSSLENAKVEQKVTTVNDLNDEAVLAVVQKQMKTLEQELDSLKTANRDTEKVENQKSVVKEYLPEQMSEETLRDYINGQIVTLNIDSVKLQGKLMGVLSQELKGKADMGLVSKLVRELLNK